jgi:broad specificity phosphatase PhoE
MVVSFIPHDGGGPQGKLADAELHFTDGPLEGLKLIGFTVWEGRTPAKLNVTFPARQYSVNGERRSFALLRGLVDQAAVDRLRQVILDAYAEHQRMAIAS